ncbi:pentatricopeptide repeat-containing protein At1g08070, chloroplastic-like [Telopea speciosissima]|uniref:pentatricopeptide repeat-containing protein At1g08070, chloroplastic-like n=1 Tax=Telopea speciosissima TaxID=54955 RepID=UPI001CC77F3F|nr:pentatricopeptide repeat-containing protein At1g08070, chloroplastic-like [Telopea speciosissima]
MNNTRSTVRCLTSKSLLILSLLDSCKNMRELKQIQAQIIKEENPSPYEVLIAVERLISYCAVSPNGSLDYAKALFNQLSNPTVISWNFLIRGLSTSKSPREAISLYQTMHNRGFQPNKFTFPFVIKACTESSMTSFGVLVHTHLVKIGLEADSYIRSSLIHMYANGEYLDDAKQVFDVCSDRDVVSWNAMIDGYAKYGKMELALSVFEKMVCRDVISWNTMINGYSTIGNIEEAKRLFDEMPEKNVVSWNSMLAGYVKFGDIEAARGIFGMMPRRDVVSWNAMLACYAQSGRSNDALYLFDEMQVQGIKPTEATMVSLLSACAHLGALDLGVRLHKYIDDNKIAINTILGTALVDMYSKCGSISKAAHIFCSINYKDVLAWNTIIAGMAMHGHAKKAFHLFTQMQVEDVVPDDITFVAMLSACSHAGMINEGQRLLATMSTTYGIEPKVEHYGCVIDLLARAGLLKEAVKVIATMPMEANASAWGALLGGCRIHGNIEVGEVVGKCLINQQPHHSGRYVILSNLYAAAKRWDDVRKVRNLMRSKGVAKLPGVSMIELKGIVHQFVAGDRSHPESDQIYKKLSEISTRLKNILGYLPDTQQVLLDIEEEEKEHVLLVHSEKLAIAFGFIHLGPLDPIRVVKNLRVCSDCHTITKLISKVYGREIIVRDRNRFHQFKDGRCSCMDYW